MKPFFSYYGSKWNLSRLGFYSAPRGDVVVELFAGSAAYSVYHEPQIAILLDKNPDIISIWSYLINASEEDIDSLPLSFESMDEINELDIGPRNLIKFWVAKAVPAPRKKLSRWYFNYRGNGVCNVWGEAVKRRIIHQLPKIRNWQAYCMSYDEFDFSISGRTYFIDPPYSGSAGRDYPYDSVEYDKLSRLIKSINSGNQIIACENEQLATHWADFDNSVPHRGMRSRTMEFKFEN